MGAGQQGKLVSSGAIVDARQMGGKRTAIRAALVAARACGCRVLLVVGSLVAGNGLLDIFQGQSQLLGIELLRTPAELRTLQLPQQVPQAIDLRQRLVRARQPLRRARRAPPRSTPAALRCRSEAEVRSRSRPTLNQIRAPLWNARRRASAARGR
jgi:hypothetical protein